MTGCRLAVLQDALHVRACMDDHCVGAKFLGKVVPLPFVGEQGGTARWEHSRIREPDEPDEHVETAGARPPPRR